VTQDPYTGAKCELMSQNRWDDALRKLGKEVPMRILVLGAGVVGSFNAARLTEAGQDVTVLTRGRRLEALGSRTTVACWCTKTAWWMCIAAFSISRLLALIALRYL